MGNGQGLALIVLRQDRLGELGQTFYFSRVLSEEVDSPTLRLDTSISSVAVFLDGALIYTDCPELNNRIGDLRLPMLEWYREEPVLVTLPENYQGKTPPPPTAHGRNRRSAPTRPGGQSRRTRPGPVPSPRPPPG